jgi:gentisate 1,2-dioxygenase
MSAFRFILQGHGAYTNVDGEKMVMEDGDLILTPHGCWHEHAHEGDENMVWIDGLDVPFVQALQQISFDPYNGRLPVTERVDAASFYGVTRPVGASAASQAPKLLHYHWRDTYPALQRLVRLSTNSFDGAALEFIDPATGGPTLPTMSCRVQMLRPGEKTQSHRHTSTAIYHAFRGSGTTMINSEKFSWQKGDTFIVPLWSWHEHRNASATDEAILFSMHDEPILRAFGLYREEAEAK